MDKELAKALAQSLLGPQADTIVAQIEQQIQQWGLVLPHTPPLVFDFGTGDVFHTGETEYWIANELEHGYCGKYLFLLAGQRCPEHRHTTKHETFFIVKGTISMRCEEVVRTMAPGDALAVEPGIAHTFSAIENSLVLEISKPSVIADNTFLEKGIGYNR